MAFRVNRERFRELAESALERLPEEYRKYFMNITISVEDYPCREDAERLNLKRNRLLGLYSGVPHTDKEGFFTIPYPLPDRIILYQRNIEDICSTEEELVEQIWKTLIHEVGHYFGLSEKDMGKYE
ncbi:MAG: metallopeptidase family protein [Thermodesulfovibrionales bacterium]|nr:metallopeptidase family protein [Nitrospirota bacterium]MBU4320351.1 metallopeptidase family protein [Nitrospinota bacterium]MCG2709198.1 metallopeptidase family protein [Thermodesulfovibrionales bacterium]MCG2814105.1 metallopeptidase family protein [Thermodesulfovibrionales bacterium]MDP3260963.1 metallopeptidase family protein [Thermodesulfovibrionales bacterium]